MMRKVLKRNWGPLVGSAAADAMGWFTVWSARSQPGSLVLFVVVAGFTLVLLGILLTLLQASAEVIRLTEPGGD